MHAQAGAGTRCSSQKEPLEIRRSSTAVTAATAQSIHSGVDRGVAVTNRDLTPTLTELGPELQQPSSAAVTH